MLRGVLFSHLFILFCNMRLKTQQNCRLCLPWSTEVRDFTMTDRSHKTIQIIVTRDFIFSERIILKNKLGSLTVAWR